MYIHADPDPKHWDEGKQLFKFHKWDKLAPSFDSLLVVVSPHIFHYSPNQRLFSLNIG
jgi:hypothetical protein